ncbi:MULTISPECIES: type II toxin-antitoxin system PemK/MazF family toxin [unclassified Endozoicomonas]|uniref:type II toxin-antitoxin system PemK/MazF family toxin n=1 Tax=unclassified Endozoicomonas TaxID=2644528 RepID=UPI003BB5DA7B
MKRGDIVTVSIKGDDGKPRPALIIQSNLFPEHPSVTLLPITGELRDVPLFRYTLFESKENGLNKTSQVMIDKITTIKADRIGKTIGSLSQPELTEVIRLMALWLGMA